MTIEQNGCGMFTLKGVIAHSEDNLRTDTKREANVSGMTGK
jgi:hypothetical protein